MIDDYPVEVNLVMKQVRDPLTNKYKDTLGELEFKFLDPKYNEVLRFSHLKTAWRGRISDMISNNEAEVAHVMSDMLAIAALRMSAHLVNKYRDIESNSPIHKPTSTSKDDTDKGLQS